MSMICLVFSSSYEHSSSMLTDLKSYLNYCTLEKDFQIVPEHVSGVNVSFTLNHLTELAQSEGVIKWIGTIKVNWVDSGIPTSFSEHKYLSTNNEPSKNMSHSKTYFVVRTDCIWTPSMVLVNSVKNPDVLLTSSNFANIDPWTGEMSVEWSIDTSTTCAVDFTKFPHDEHSCAILLSFLDSPDVTVSRIDAVFISDKQPMTNSVWELLHIGYSNNAISGDDYINVTIDFKRASDFHFVVICFPVFMVNLISGFVYFIPLKSGERVTVSIILFLTLSLIISVLSELIPSKSTQMPLLSFYLIGSLFVSSLFIILNIVIVRIVTMGINRKSNKGMKSNEYQTDTMKTVNYTFIVIQVTVNVVSIATITLLIYK